MTIKAFFPTYVYSAALGGKLPKKFHRDLEDECYRIRDADVEGHAWSEKNYPGGFTSYGSMCRLHKFSSVFGELEKRVVRHVKAFAKHLEWDMRGRELTMTDCWVNIMPLGAIHSFHIHPISSVSGTYYVRTPKGTSKLKFEDPRSSKMMAAPPKIADARPEIRPFVEYPAEAGNVLLWESWMRHEVPMNVVDDERVSVSFNLNWF